ncbi:MAG: glycoside hydrolase family 3 N-terminal domain-containing protein [Alkalispirochaeta sp.]
MYVRTFRSVVVLPVLAIVFAGCVSAPVPEEPPASEMEGAERVATALGEMTLRERIAQRFVIAVPRNFADDGEVARAFVRTLATNPPAGVILYPWNYADRDDVIRITGKMQRAVTAVGASRLLISVDQEGGRVAAFRFGDIVRTPAAADMARHRDPEFIEAAAYVVGIELRSMGITMNYAPVLDVPGRADDSIIGDRAWSGDAEVVRVFASSYLAGMERAGVIATAKHFPGHGVTFVDSHGRLPVVDMTWEELRARHLIPFEAAISAEVPAIMTAHLLFPPIDPEFAVTISRQFLHRLLRDEMGYTGVVVSDALSMKAMADNYDLDLILERAIRYDVDLLLLNEGFDYPDVVRSVERLLAEGRITEDDIDRGTRRVLRLKHRYDLLHESTQ